MKRDARKIALRCAVYTRVSTDSGLEQDFNSLDNQREASEAYIKSQAHEGWKLVRERYDDGGFSGVRWTNKRRSGRPRSQSLARPRLFPD
jgi:site-specific DNA recombinase